jgi:hypothetical protein
MIENVGPEEYEAVRTDNTDRRSSIAMILI